MQKQSTKPSNNNCDEHDHGVQFKFEYKYCPMCATEMEWRHVFGAQRQQCPNCGWVHFRNLKVGAGVLAERDGKVVLARRGINPGKNKWCFPSGFVEYNESPKMGAVREFKEETPIFAARGLWCCTAEKSSAAHLPRWTMWWKWVFSEKTKFRRMMKSPLKATVSRWRSGKTAERTSVFIKNRVVVFFD